MEEIEGMFSSPEQSPRKDGFQNEIETTGSEGMSMDEGMSDSLFSLFVVSLFAPARCLGLVALDRPPHRANC